MTENSVLCDVVQSLIADDAFQHILRVLNTNVDGKQKIMFALTAIRGIGRRFSNIACKKAEVDMRKRWALLLCMQLGIACGWFAALCVAWSELHEHAELDHL